LTFSRRQTAYNLTAKGTGPSAKHSTLGAKTRLAVLPPDHPEIARTEAGEKLLAQLGPAAETITETLDDLSRLQARPSGTLRLLVHRMALSQVIEPVLSAFRQAYPGVNVEIAVNDAQIELVEGGYETEPETARLLRVSAGLQSCGGVNQVGVPNPFACDPAGALHQNRRP
jgi:hypothetical protein